MSDYGGFGGIVKEAQAIAEKPTPITACPLCGTVLDKNSRGQVNCPMGHFRAESDR